MPTSWSKLGIWWVLKPVQVLDMMCHRCSRAPLTSMITVDSGKKAKGPPVDQKQKRNWLFFSNLGMYFLRCNETRESNFRWRLFLVQRKYSCKSGLKIFFDSKAFGWCLVYWCRSRGLGAIAENVKAVSIKSFQNCWKVGRFQYISQIPGKL